MTSGEAGRPRPSLPRESGREMRPRAHRRVDRLFMCADYARAPKPMSTFNLQERPNRSREVDRLGLEVLVEPLDATLAADARLLEAAERHLRIDDHAVDRDASRSHPARHLVAVLGVFRVDGPVQ